MKKAKKDKSSGRIVKLRKWLKRQSVAVVVLENDPHAIAQFRLLATDWDCILLVTASIAEARTMIFSNYWRLKAVVIGQVGFLPGHTHLLRLTRKERKKFMPTDKEAFKFLRTVQQLRGVRRIAATGSSAVDEALYSASVVDDRVGTPLIVAQKGLGLKL